MSKLLDFFLCIVLIVKALCDLAEIFYNLSWCRRIICLKISCQYFLRGSQCLQFAIRILSLGNIPVGEVIIRSSITAAKIMPLILCDFFISCLSFLAVPIIRVISFSHLYRLFQTVLLSEKQSSFPLQNQVLLSDRPLP